MKRDDEDPFKPDRMMETVDWIALLFVIVIAVLAILSFSEDKEGTVNTHPSQEETHNETIEDTDRNQVPATDSSSLRNIGVDAAPSSPGIIPDSIWKDLHQAGGECHVALVFRGMLLDTEQPNPIRVPLAWCRAAFGIAVQPS